MDKVPPIIAKGVEIILVDKENNLYDVETSNMFRFILGPRWGEYPNKAIIQHLLGHLPEPDNVPCIVQFDVVYKASQPIPRPVSSKGANMTAEEFASTYSSYMCGREYRDISAESIAVVMAENDATLIIELIIREVKQTW